ncbi:MAG TPA: ABC transporter substrate-binding protein [Streptosporangiaceae bacterium]|nr:ABC transporter substrate-binding protein [Streptosporangiaceae bacterium]
MKRLMSIGVILVASLLAAACGTSSSSSSGSGGGSSSGPSGVLTIDNESGSLWTCNFNPYNLSDIGYSFGPVYEPLVFVNTLQSAKATPWLASSWTYSNGDKTLTFTIRGGVKWSDGKPMTAADVVYSFNLLKKFKALDINAVWSVLSSVTQQGTDQVVMTFKAPATNYFYYIADQVAIVPRHIWSKIADPVKYPDTQPVGTGAFTTSCTAQNITFTANPHYYVPGEPKLKTVNYPAFTSNDTANTYLANGQAQWGGQFIPSIQKFYLSKSPDNHYWFPPVANVSMFPNLKNPVLANVAVRQAMSYAINKQRASTIGEYGYEPASNQAGVVTPTFSSWLDTSQAAAYGNNYAYNPAKAISILKAAGYTKGSDGIMAKNGQKLSFSIINNGGFSDWVAVVNVLQADLKAVGIQVTPKNMAAPAYQAALYDGNFQLAYGSETGGPTPYYELRQWLYSANTAAIGQPAGSNFERYSSSATDALINSYGATADAATQHAIVSKLEAVMLQDVPVIPVTESVDWYQYSTANFTGWITQSDPYAQPAPYSYPDWGQLMLKVGPK